MLISPSWGLIIDFVAFAPGILLSLEGFKFLKSEAATILDVSIVWGICAICCGELSLGSFFKPIPFSILLFPWTALDSFSLRFNLAGIIFICEAAHLALSSSSETPKIPLLSCIRDCNWEAFSSVPVTSSTIFWVLFVRRSGELSFISAATLFSTVRSECFLPFSFLISLLLSNAFANLAFFWRRASVSRGTTLHSFASWLWRVCKSVITWKKIYKNNSY